MTEKERKNLDKNLRESKRLDPYGTLYYIAGDLADEVQTKYGVEAWDKCPFLKEFGTRALEKCSTADTIELIRRLRVALGADSDEKKDYAGLAPLGVKMPEKKEK